MARTEELPPKLRTFVQMYAWRRNDPVPWAPSRKPLRESRIGLVVTPCQVVRDQRPFRAVEPDFDAGIRIVPSDTDPRTMVNTYPEQAFDHAGLQEDANLLIPLDRLRAMTAAGEIAGVTPRVVSLCGHLPHPERLIAETAPETAHIFREDGADAVLLVPA